MQLRYHLHGEPILFQTEDERILARLRKQWTPFAAGVTQTGGGTEGDRGRNHPIEVHLTTASPAPPPPAYPPVSSGPTTTYYQSGNRLTAYIPHWGRFDVDLESNMVTGTITPACISTYGVFEDMIIVALSPLLRRRGYYTIHAFAAAIDGRAAVLIGDIGAGKSTTGISLLCQGARLISNDSPLLHVGEQDGVRLCAYPGLLSTYPDTLSWFPDLSGILDRAQRMEGSEKISFALDDIWPSRWGMAEPPGALFFPKISPGLTASKIEPLPRFQALQRLVSQSIENWDIETIPANLRALRTLVDSAPAFELFLAPDIERIPRLIMQRMRT
jgi:hypothetical protein